MKWISNLKTQQKDTFIFENYLFVPNVNQARAPIKRHEQTWKTNINFSYKAMQFIYRNQFDITTALLVWAKKNLLQVEKS